MSRVSDTVLQRFIDAQNIYISKYEKAFHDGAEWEKELLALLEELKEYRAGGLSVDKLAEIDRLYLEKCREADYYKKKNHSDSVNITEQEYQELKEEVRHSEIPIRSQEKILKILSLVKEEQEDEAT